MGGIAWTKKEEDTVVQHFAASPRAELLQMLPGRTYSAIKLRAGKLSVSRPHPDYRNGSLAPLLQTTPEALYWMGFLLADGHFGETRLQVLLSKKDEGHLRLLSRFLGGPNIRFQPAKLSPTGYTSFEGVVMSVAHAPVMREIRERWGIVNDKTHVPPNLSWLSEDELVYVLVGFIDGDGCIQRGTKGRGTAITILNHTAWGSTLGCMSAAAHAKVGETAPRPYVNSAGFAVVHICKSETVRFLKCMAGTVPAMQRKWRVVDENFVSREEVTKNNIKRATSLLATGASQREVASQLGMSASSLSHLLIRKGLRKSSKT